MSVLLSPKAKRKPVNRQLVAARILAFTADGTKKAGCIVVWRRKEISSALTRAERPTLEDALAQLTSRGELIPLVDSRGQTFYLPASSIARSGPSSETLPEDGLPLSVDLEDLPVVYARVVRESGGFPDVKISVLRRAMLGVSPARLEAHLRALWQSGQATLSLGDWSLASEEMRAAALELGGENYLLVRMEEPSEEPSLK